MRERFRIVLLWGGAGLACLVALFGLTAGPMLYRVMVGFHTYETTPPVLPSRLNGTAILIFSKTNGYRHGSIGAATAALTGIAARRGWSSFSTENGAVFSPELLGRFKAVVWNNVSGDVLNVSQRAALKDYLEAGGGFVGIHAAGGDLHYAWRWYVDTLIGAQFIGHTLGPQFQPATIRIEDRTHPATRGLGASWDRTDEWYSFASSPRKKDYHVLASLDESTYRPAMAIPVLGARDIRMGDHPIMWTHCVGKGRVFFSALGHLPDAYDERNYVQVLDGAIAWAAGMEGSACADVAAGGRTTP